MSAASIPLTSRFPAFRVWCVALVLLLLPSLAIAADPEHPAAFGFHTRTWTTDDGLPHNAVTRILQDSLGFLWFGTPGGLARFDGREFYPVPLSQQSGNTVYSVRGLAEESPGSVLLLAGNQLFRVDDKGTSVHPSSSRFPQLGEDPLDLYVEPSGAIWVATNSGIVLRWHGDADVKIFGRETRVATRSKRFSFATDGNGVTWIASDGYLATYENGQLRRHPQAPAGQILIALSRSGSVWVCTEDKLLKTRKDSLQIASDRPPWTGDFNAVRYLSESAAGELLVTGRGVIHRFQAGRFASFPIPTALANSIVEDREGNIWIGTNGSGAAQMHARSHRIFLQRSGVHADSVSSLAEDAHGQIWVANRSAGLHVVVPATGEVTRVQTEAAAIPVDVVTVSPAGEVWFGGVRSGLWRIHKPGTEPLRIPAPSEGVNALLATRSGSVWFATTLGELGCFTGEKLEWFHDRPGYLVRRVYALAEDPDGSIWVGGREGNLTRWTGKQFEHVNDPAIRSVVHDLRVDRSGNLWVGTASGLAVRMEGKFYLITSQHGLPDDIIYNVIEDDADRMWLATRRGLFYASRSELLSVARTAGTAVVASRFGPEQGLQGFTPNPNYFPGVLKTRAGTLWFSSTQGAVEVDPARLISPPGPPTLKVHSISWDGAPQTWSNDEALRLPSGRHRLDAKLLVLSFTDTENLVLEHRLAGFDARWIATSNDRTATYTNLPPGTYQLFARVRRGTGPWTNEKLLLTLQLTPAWWETDIARIAALLLLISLVALLSRAIAQRRLRHRLRLLEQQQALERERSRIARDLHDELGAGLTEVGLLADRLVTTVPADVAPQLSGLAWRARRLATDLSGIVWTMNAHHCSLDQFAVFLRRYSERLFRNTGTRCVTHGVETIPSVPLSPGVQHHLLALAKEALNNALKHARATEVRIELNYDGGEFSLRIADNGVGCSDIAERDCDGNGLRNMRSRLQELGGTLDVQSDLGKGTSILMRVPLEPARE
jgi:signal transduction histidine kinase/ligand-binding sensor domain-containing protein